MRRHQRPDAPIGRDDVDWDELFRLYAPRLRRCLAKRVADAAIVDDVVQETFIQAYRRWSTYDQSRPLWPWLMAIAANRAWRWSQASRRAAEPDGGTRFVGPPLRDYLQAGSDEHVTNLHRRRAMRTALDAMPEKHRRILLAWELGDRSVADLAASEGMTPEELRATVVRARRGLRRRYLDAAGDGHFGWVVVGLGGLVSRWRDRLARLASNGGLAETASSLAAVPMVAAGMAMITLVPAPSSQRPPVGSLAEKPVALVQGPPTDRPAPAADEAAVAAAPATEAVGTPWPARTGTSPRAAAPTVTAGPAAAVVAAGPNSYRQDVNVDKPGGGTTVTSGSSQECEGIVLGTTCEVLGLLPGPE
ncbi:MAG TPA: sigma-70 family RNA polymerase sigma factor [Acidimicrobiales bacterium]|nr:sigma-70 family RNA polymerase sigma factor [Acidimicrobiales bacterium]